MKTPVTCPGCHRRYEVDERFAGKTLKCAHCETSMRVPAAEPDDPPEQPGFGEYELGETRARAPTTFRAPRTRSDLEPSRGQSRVRGKKKKAARRGGRGDRSRQPVESLLANPSVLIALAAIAVAVALLGYFVPSAKRFAGVVLALPGLLLFLYGYATAVYIAFTEDDLYGWLFLLFPFYAAYYVVSRWDEMSGRLVMVGVGLTLLAIGGQFLEADRAREVEVSAKASAKA